jgi:hypothetical protein
MAKITLTNIVEGILKNTNKSYKILSSTPKKTRFKLNCESVQLFGTVTDSEYQMQIKKADGTVLDSVKCPISQTDDIFNRINESVSTGVKLSKYVNAVNEAKRDFFTSNYIKEDEDIDDTKEILLDDETDGEEETIDLRSALENIIDQLMILAEDASDCVDLVSGTENDADNKATMVSIMGGMYSLADDVQSFIEDVYPTEEQDECYKKESKVNKNIKKEVANKLSEAALLIRNNRELKNVKEAIRVVKSSLIAD